MDTISSSFHAQVENFVVNVVQRPALTFHTITDQPHLEELPEKIGRIYDYSIIYGVFQHTPRDSALRLRDQLLAWLLDA